MWVVQTLVDQPCDRTADTSADCQADGYRNNVPQMIQSYYSDWTLTGMNVREEHGADMAIFYEDPAVDDNKKDDGAIWALSHVLEQQFTTAHDADNDEQRDLKLADFTTRFDRDNNPTDDQRMGVPNILQVVTNSYPTMDQAIATTAMTETGKILNNVFKPVVEGDRQIKPLLLFAQEQRIRQLTLSLAVAGGGYVTQNGTNLTIDMAPAGGSPAQTVDTVAGVKWLGYCAPATGPVTLTPCDDETYWTELDNRYAALPVLPEDLSPDWMGGRIQFAQMYYTSLRGGFYSTVQMGIVVPPTLLPLPTQTETADVVRGGLRGLATVPVLAGMHFTFLFPPGHAGSVLTWGAEIRKAVKLAETALTNATKRNYASSYAQSRYAANIKGAQKALNKAQLQLTSFRLQIASAALSVFQVALQVLSYIPQIPLEARGVLGSLAFALSLGITVIMPAVMLIKSYATSLAGIAKLFNGIATLNRSMKIGGAVGAVISIGVTWGFFIYGAIEGGLKAGSPQLNRLAMEAVAATVVTILFAVLALNPVGMILSAIIGVIDFLLNLICELGVKDLQNVPGQEGSCFTIGGTITKYLAKLLYSYDLMIDLEHRELMLAGAPDVTLANPSKGFVGGNPITVTMAVTTTAVHKDPDPNNGVLIYPYMFFFSEDNLKRSAFRYSLTNGVNEVPSVDLDSMTGSWKDVKKDHTYLVSPMYRGQIAEGPPALRNLPMSTGLDRHVPLMLNMGYAIPAYECWLLVIFPMCYMRSFKGDNHMPIDSLYYDVLPPTLAGFLALGSKGDGGLGQLWDARFRSLADADGDGLRSTAYKGLDPNDATPDSDGDGLTDAYELNQQAGGRTISPVLRDTDNDGLPDPQELRIGSNPNLADSDNDGLTDGQEVAHLKIDPGTGLPTTLWEGGWDVVINAIAPFTVHVSSDPLSADSDNDGLTDQTERQLALDANPANRVDSENQPYHPAVYNTPPLALLVDTGILGNYFAPGQTIRYTSTVIANAAMAPGVLTVNAPAILGGERNPLALTFNPLAFSVVQSVTVPVSLTVAGGIGTQETYLASTASTRLQDTGPASWGFAPITTQPALGGIGAPALPYYTDVTASRPDRQDSYQIATLAFDSLGSIGRGDILDYSLPDGAMRAIENDSANTTAFMSNAAPSVATNGNGDTLAVWSQMRFCNTITFNSLKVVTAGADADASAGIEPIITLTPSGGSESTIWSWNTAGGTSMVGGQLRGPNANGFPIDVTYCNGSATLKVYDVDNGFNELVQSQLVDQFFPQNGVRTFTGAGHTIEVNTTVPLRDGFVVAGALLGPDGAVKRAITFPSSPVPTSYDNGNLGPTVASNGNGFLVAYESYSRSSSGATPSNPQIAVQAFDRDGNALNKSYRDAGSILPSENGVSNFSMAAAWIGDKYRVVWQDRRTGNIRQADVTADGSSIGAPTTIATQALANVGANYGPSIAYDPITNRTIVVYSDFGKNAVGVLYQGDTLITAKYIILPQYPKARSPQVVWHPGYRGWLFSYQDDNASQRHVFLPLDSNGDLTFNPATGFFIAANDNSLACPAPQSQPVVDLHLEDLPGATTFVDASGWGNNAICTGASCPAAGFVGAPNAPQSDYAVKFDGVDDGLTLNNTAKDDHTITFWYKAPTSNTQQMLVDGGWPAANGFRIMLTNGALVLRYPGINYQTATRYDDGQWHFVAVSHSKASGRLDAYVDGNLVFGFNASADVTHDAVNDFRIGKSRTDTLPLLATLDQFQIYPAAMAQNTVQDLMNRTLQSYCVAAGASSSNVYWAKVIASKPDVRGGAVSVRNGLTLTIDSDLPTAQITSVQDNDLVGAAQVIGGVAGDPTSGVGIVEVSINNGDWKLTEGANTWVYSLAGYDGPISVRVRATDNVGNIGDLSAPMNLVVDGVAPVVTVTPQPATIKPTKNAGGVWQVALAGTASDANGVKPESMRVRLEQQSGVGVAQTAQQPVLNSPNWNIHYLLDRGLYDPTGAYTVTVEATDNLENRATPAVTVVRLDGRGPDAILRKADATRQVISQTITISGQISDTDSIVGIDKLEIAFTPVEQVVALPPGLTGDEADARLNRVWTPVTLAKRGDGVTKTTWSYQIPNGLENIYQLDLRGTDMLGNVNISGNQWRGMIDTTDPRVVMRAKNTGASYVDANNRKRYAVRFLCAAVDRNLNEKSFDCPGEGIAEPVRTFESIPALQTLFPDLTLRTGLAISYTLWMTTTKPAATALACDTVGRCAQASTPQIATESEEFAAVGAAGERGAAPQAVIVTPTEGGYVAAGDTLSVTVAAEGSTALKTIAINLDGNLVQTLDFTQEEALTQVQRTVAIAIDGEGAHTLVAQTTDWAGSTQTTLYPVQFTADQAAPAVTIDASTLTNADTWQPKSGILRFNGAASDGVGLAAVQVRVDDGEFVDATFDNSTWRTAVHVPNPEGRTLVVTVRASDLAMQTTEITQSVGTDLSAGVAPDTTITNGPADPSNTNTASFVFTGSASAAVFECQLDGSDYQPCASPHQYDDLSKGEHLFRVRAVNAFGSVDLSPAEFTWTVNASQPNATITGKPTNPTTERIASFTFTGDATAASFECSLDGSDYAACASPQTYGGLADGEHTFLVRARDGANKAGAAERYTWTVVNAPPVAIDQTVMIGLNQVKAIVLSADDNEPLRYNVVTPPAHGVLTGLAPNLSYAPDTDYAGVDSFTFGATDGQGASATGIVTITVSAEQQDVQSIYMPSLMRQENVQAIEQPPVEAPEIEQPADSQPADSQPVEYTESMYLPSLGK
ncbi:MAG: hypothetical protein IPK16_18285 [Anaerolineales bacterium]|nr:hypothetical protein [Anaerolineales bacterium]